MKPDSIRCFVAIEIHDRIKTKLGQVQNTLRPHINGASWTKQENLHLTLKFLGDVNNSNLHILTNSLEDVVIAHKPFLINIGGIGAFPNFRQPRILWIGLKQGSEPVSKLAHAIDFQMSKLGFQKDNRFHPHLTIARIKKRVNLNTISNSFKEYDTLNETSMTVNEIVLVKSELHHKGAVYTALKICELNKEH